MKHLRTWGIFLAVLPLSVCSMAQRKVIQRSDLPSAVEQSIQGELHGAEFISVSKETEKGKLFYYVDMNADGLTRAVKFAPNGNVEEIEEAIAFETLPTEVKAGIIAKSKHATVTKVVSLRRQDKLVAYEAQIEKNGMHSEIHVGPHGEQLLQK